MNENDIRGAAVLINPLLSDDPFGKTGQVGIVTEFYVPTDDFYVKFDDLDIGLYSASALLLLQKPEKIYGSIERHADTFPPELATDLKNIALLQRYGTGRQWKMAFEVALKNENTRLWATVGLDQELGMQQNFNVKR